MTAPNAEMTKPESIGRELTHGCARCGAPVPLDVGLCERCNPLGLRDVSSSQVHGIAIGGVIFAIVVLAIVARLALSGIGPFEAAIMTVAPDGDALVITLAVTNRGTNGGQTTCRVMDPADRTGSLGGFMLSPTIGAGQTVEFTQRIRELGGTARQLTVECSAP